MGIYDKNSILSQQTSMRIEYGNRIKNERNRRKTNGLFILNAHPMQTGEKVQETLSDPLHRSPAYIIQQQRIEASGAGRSRGYYRPAAPQQVNWKYGFWKQQPGHIGARIGPYNASQEQSIWYRISGFMSGGK